MTIDEFLAMAGIPNTGSGEYVSAGTAESLPAVMNAFYHNPNEETQGFKGWYQRMCHKMNRKGFQYIVGEDAFGNENITFKTCQ